MLKKLLLFISVSLVSLSLLVSASAAQNQDNDSLRKSLIGIKKLKIEVVVKTLSECSVLPSDRKAAVIKFFGKEENRQSVEMAQKVIKSYLQDFLKQSNTGIIEEPNIYDAQLTAIYSDGYQQTDIPDEARLKERIPASEAVQWLIKPILYFTLTREGKEECAQTFETSLDPVPNSPYSYITLKSWINENEEKFLISCRTANVKIEPDPFSGRKVIGEMRQPNFNKSLEVEEFLEEIGTDTDTMFDMSSRRAGNLPFWTKKIIQKAKCPKGEVVVEIKTK